MFIELCKINKLVMHLNSYSLDLGRDKLGSQTPVLVGTIGYLALKRTTTGRTSRESYVYCFGVVSQEIAWGRNPIEPQI